MAQRRFGCLRCIPSGARHDGYAASGLRLLRTTSLRFTLHGWQRATPVVGLMAVSEIEYFSGKLHAEPDDFGIGYFLLLR